MTPLGLQLAGYTLAHAACIICDLPAGGTLLVPLAVMIAGGKQITTRFPAPHEPVATLKRLIAEASPKAEAWAFAHEAVFTNIKTHTQADVLRIDFWEKGMAQPTTLMQKFEPSTPNHHFRLIGDPDLLFDGQLQKPDVAEPLLKEIIACVMKHPEAKKRWAVWREQ